MTNDPHPFGYTVAMRQVMLTAALVVGGLAALVTPSLFASSIFADAYFNAAAALPTNFMVAQVGSAGMQTAPTSVTGAPQRPPMKEMQGGLMQPGQMMQQGGQNMPKPMAPAEIVKVLVSAGIISSDKAQEAVEVLRKAMTQGNVNPRACINFARQLKIGDRGQDVKMLNEMLKKAGHDAGEGEEYTDATASGVTALQEENASEVLAPSGLKHGTGVVGKATIMKLNKLQACADAGFAPPQSGNSSGTTQQPTAEMLKMRQEMEQKIREACAAGKCPDPKTIQEMMPKPNFPMQPKPQQAPATEVAPTDANTATPASGAVAP